MLGYYTPATTKTAHHCQECTLEYVQLVGETLDQARDRHGDSPEGYRAHVAAGMPTTPSLENMDDVEADEWA